MAEPPPDPVDPLDPVPVDPVPVEPGDETIVQDAWADETVVVEEREEVVPPRRLPVIWPWLLALLLFVLGGLGAIYYFSQKDDDSGAATTTVAQVDVPILVGLREARARELIREAGLEVATKAQAGNKPRGVVMAQRPEPGESAERGDQVLITISQGPPKETVPEVVGEQSAEALADLKDAGFGSKVSQAYAEESAGTVVEQDPAAGTKLKKDAVVSLVVSKGPEPVPVPSVVGQQASEATATLRDAGFEAAVATVPSNEPSGTVVAQSPAAGNEAKKGSRVRINVAQDDGAGTTATTPATTQASTQTQPTTTAATPTTPAPKPATVPDVVGQELADAARAFGDEGLKVAVKLVPSDEQRGTVIAQAQPAGTQRRQGDTVQVNVALGPEPPAATTVPQTVGQAQQQARQRLEAAGFEVLAIELPTADRTRVGRVLSQTPAGNAQIPEGSLVILYVGAAP